MSEPGFREIQLNTKQVVFLFIAVVTAAVGIFLLGVSVGKGVTPDRPGEMVQAAGSGCGCHGVGHDAARDFTET